MLWLLIMASALGALLGGLLLRVHAVLSVSCVLAALSIFLMALGRFSLLKAAAVTLALLAALHCGYLAGLISSYALRRSALHKKDRRDGSCRHEGSPQ